MRAFLAAGVLAAVACSAASAPVVTSSPHEDARDGSVAFHDASVGDRVARGELAWTVAHLADDPHTANPRETDAVLRLVRLGPEGVLAAAEVLRVGDARRRPFAERVVERVALRRCSLDASRAAAVIASIERGSPVSPVADAGVRWTLPEGPWPAARIEGLRAWALAGAPCDTPATDAGLADATSTD